MSIPINHLDPPFLELGFYFSPLSEKEAFTLIFEVLIQRGATFAGKAKICKNSAATESSLSERENKFDDCEIVILDLNDLQKALLSDKINVEEIAMNNAIGISKSAAEIITYNSIYSEEATQKDKHPISILTEGAMFSEPEILRQTYGKENIRQAGLKVYQRFKSLVQQLNPSYASITVEYGLECPTDLQIDCRSLAFSDFFASQDFFGQSNLNILSNLFEDAYQEKLDNGIYISCNDDVNPEFKAASLEIDEQGKRMQEVAKIITSIPRQSL